MAIKEFTAEARFECGLDAIVAGKVWAFISVIGEHNPWRLGVAIANQPGYYPVPEFWCHATEGRDMDAFHAHVDALNAAEGLTTHEALRIMASSMAAGRVGTEIAARHRNELFPGWTADDQAAAQREGWQLLLGQSGLAYIGTDTTKDTFTGNYADHQADRHVRAVVQTGGGLGVDAAYRALCERAVAATAEHRKLARGR